MRLNRLAALFIAVVVALSVVGAGVGTVAADEHDDADGWYDGMDETEFTANSSDERYVALEDADSEFEDVSMTLEYSNETVLEMDRSFLDEEPGDSEYVEVTSTTGDDYVADTSDAHVMVFDLGELSNVPVQPGDDNEVEIDGTVTYTDAAEEEQEVEFTVTLEPTDERSVATVFSEDDTEHTERSATEIMGFTLFGTDADEYVVEEELTVEDDTDETVVYLENGSVADAYSDRVDADSGDALFALGAMDDDDLVWVFYNEADSDIVDEDDDHYIVYDSSADALEFHNADDDLDLTVVNSAPGSFDAVGFMDLQDQFGWTNVFSAWQVPLLFIGSGLMTAGVVASRKPAGA